MEFGPKSEFARNIMVQRYSQHRPGETPETWEEIAWRVASEVMSAAPVDNAITLEIFEAIRDMKFMPGGRYLRSAGQRYHQVQNCLLLRAEDSREGWGELLNHVSVALMTGAGVGVDYSAIRANGLAARRSGGKSRGPLALMQAVNDVARQIVSPGDRRSALWAGLRWDHPDVLEFVTMKNWSDEEKAAKAKNPLSPAPMDNTNISVVLDARFFDAVSHQLHPQHRRAVKVYRLAVRQMLETGEPGFSVDIDDARDSLRNACTEITSSDDSDICNLGSINLARIDSIEEMRRITQLGTMFLLAGTLYSDVPYAKVDQVRTKNRRLGLGLMGVHEFLLKRGLLYGPCDALGDYLEVYAESGMFATSLSHEWNITAPVATRAIAPTGTIAIVAETTSGIEPVFCVAYKRRYVKGDQVHFQYVVDPTAKRLIESGVDHGRIEDAYNLAANVERRVLFQAWVQQFVDHGISSTVNLPAWGTPLNNELVVDDFAELLLTYLPRLRGITVYPDGARGGQPLSPISYTAAASYEGLDFIEEQADVCDISKGGRCD